MKGVTKVSEYRRVLNARFTMDKDRLLPLLDVRRPSCFSPSLAGVALAGVGGITLNAGGRGGSRGFLSGESTRDREIEAPGGVWGS